MKRFLASASVVHTDAIYLSQGVLSGVEMAEGAGWGWVGRVVAVGVASLRGGPM